MKRFIQTVAMAALLMMAVPTAIEAQSENAPYGYYNNTDHPLCPPLSGYIWPTTKPYGQWDNSVNYNNYHGDDYGCRTQNDDNDDDDDDTNDPPIDIGIVRPEITHTSNGFSWAANHSASLYFIFRGDQQVTELPTTASSYDTTVEGNYQLLAGYTVDGSTTWLWSNTIAITGGSPVNPLVCDSSNYLFEDDFDGTSINTAKWDAGIYWVDDLGGSNPNAIEKQEYQLDFNSDVYEVSNGSLKIKGMRNGSGYHSGALHADLRDVGFSYGCYEARMRLPDDGSGTWPAFWLISNRGGPSGGDTPEIDIMENLGSSANIARYNVHWSNATNGSFNEAPGQATVDNPSDWHVYSVIWSESGLTFYLDGNQVHSTNRSPSEHMHLQLNLALNGWDHSNLIDDAELFSNGNEPTFEVDYVVATT